MLTKSVLGYMHATPNLMVNVQSMLLIKNNPSAFLVF